MILPSLGDVKALSLGRKCEPVGRQTPSPVRERWETNAIQPH